MSDFVTREFVNNEIAILRLKKPQKANALDESLMNSLYEHILFLNNNEDVKVVILTGMGKFFSAGLDLNSVIDMTANNALKKDFINFKWRFLEELNVPVIAAVNGVALGGGFELALMCDFIIASEDAVFGFPEIDLGLIPGLGGTVKLASLIGETKALELVVTGKKLKANEAEALGMIAYVVKDPLKMAIEYANIISNKSKSSLLSVKKLFKMIRITQKSNELLLEQQLFRLLLSSEEKRKNVTNFLNK